MSTKERITACFICRCNCGLVMTLDEKDRIINIRGDRDNILTKGFACEKGLKQKEHIDSRHRLTNPLKRVGEKFVEIGWDEACKEVAESLLNIKKQHGSRSLGLTFGGSPHSSIQYMMTFFLLRALGSRNIYSQVGLELSGKYLANQQLFGCSYMNGYPNIEESEFTILIGTNPLVSLPETSGT